MKTRYGCWGAWLTLLAVAMTGCGSADDKPTAVGGATPKSSVDQGRPSTAGSAKPNSDTEPSPPGITAGGGTFVPPSANVNDTDGSEAPAPPATDDGAASNAKEPTGGTRKVGAKPNPLRQPDAKPDDGAPSEEPSSPPNTNAVAGKPGKTANPAVPPKAGPGQTRLPLFEGWTKPDAVLVLTGRQNGYIEPCGCAGLVNQKGGLARRLSMIRELRERGWPVGALDVGNQVKRFGRQSEIKFQIALDGLRQMDYRVIGFGPDDLRLSSGELFAAASEEPHRFISANVTVLDPSATPTFVTWDVGNVKVGATTVLGDEYVERVKSDEVAVQPAEVGLKAAAAELAKASCDVQVLLVYGSLDETRKLARRFPQFQVVVTAGGAEEPAFEPETLAETKAQLIQVGAKGMYASVVGIYGDGKSPPKYQRVPLDDRYADSPEMLRLLGAYQDQLREAGLEGLEVKAAAHPSGRTFVGSEKCGECHSKAFAKWQETPHAHATETLVHPRERSEISRHFDPECLSCHVTGWEPQKMYPLKSGFLGLKETPKMLGSGCENCHGPGSAHVASEEKGGAAALLQQLRKEMQLPLKAAHDKCVECHDHDNSPNFHHDGEFEKYWQRVAHPGKD